MNRRSFLRYMKLGGLASVGLAAFPTLRLLATDGVKPDTRASSRVSHVQGGDNMAQAQTPEAAPRSIPLIDANAPAKTLTATFALG